MAGKQVQLHHTLSLSRPDTAGQEFDAAFSRLDHVEDVITEHRFDVMWHRQTGAWYRLYEAVTLEQALHFVETDPLLHPP